MSHLPPDHGFFAAVQVFFTEITGRAALFSSRDQLLLQEWHRQGRPAQLICRGIRNAVRSLGKDDAPRSLKECLPFIDEEWERSRALLAGAHGPALSETPAAPPVDKPRGPLFDEAAQALQKAGSTADEPRFQEAYRKAWRVLQSFDPDRFDLGDLDALDRALIDAFDAALLEEEHQALNDALTGTESLRGIRNMSPAARAEHLHHRRRRLLLHRHGLLDLIEALTTDSRRGLDTTPR